MSRRGNCKDNCELQWDSELTNVSAQGYVPVCTSAPAPSAQGSTEAARIFAGHPFGRSDLTCTALTRLQPQLRKETPCRI